MSSDLNETLRQFEAVEANLVKLEHVWKEIGPYIVSIIDNVSEDGHEAAYEELARKFRRIAATMPKIDGYELKFRDRQLWRSSQG